MSNKLFPSLWIIVVLPLLLVQSDCSCIHGDVRLVGGFGNYEGNVQVCIDGVWGYVCDNSWDTDDAKVVCRQLGYYTTYVSYRKSSYYGYGNETIQPWIDNTYCTGSEDRLIECQTWPKIGQAACLNNKIAGVYCVVVVGGNNCTNGDIRLALRYSYYNTPYNSRSEGRVEICYNNEWGTVCSNGWDSTDATVVCKQLGYTGYIDYYTSYYTYYGTGSAGSIWLDDVGCTSSHTSLLNCPYSTDTSDCTHSKDVSVRCYSRISNSCTANGDAQLWSAYDSTPDNEGIPLVCISGTWYPMRYSSDCYSYELACKAAGYSGVRYYGSYGGQYYGYYYQDHYHFDCSGSETNLNSCSKSIDANEWSYSARVVCYKELQSTSCSTEGSVQLINGKASNEGRVEYCYNNQWVPMCLINQNAAPLICKQLGYGSENFLIILFEFGKSDTVSAFTHLSCSSSSTSLSQCSVEVSSCGAAMCHEHYGIRCYDPIDECTDGDTRLVGGQIEQEGRPEVCVNGIWGQICNNEWSEIDGYVTCVTLGYIGTLGPQIFKYSEFGVGYGPIVWSNVNCDHWNTNISDCSKTTWPNFFCSSFSIAGVRCTEGCTDGDVRLVGGNSIHEGTVEICYNELWGLISDNGWSEIDARIVCTQLGYTGENFQPLLGSYYGKPNKTIHLKDVSCTSQDTSLLVCDSTQLTLADGKGLWHNTAEVAGVHCNPIKTVLCTANTDTCHEQGSIRIPEGDGGKIDYCNGKYWSPLCSINKKISTVICRQLGYTYSWSSLLLYESIGGVSSVSNMTCTGNEDSITECVITNGCTECSNHTVGLRCFDANTTVPSCDEGSVKLVNGSSESEGRVEVCVNGVWGSVCDNGWDTTDGHVICRQLGYTSTEEPTVYHNSHYGDGSYPIVYSNINCKGWEDSISDCDKDDHLSFTCYHGNTAGLRCNGEKTVDTTSSTNPTTFTNLTTFTSPTSSANSTTSTTSTTSSTNTTTSTMRDAESSGGESAAALAIVGITLGAVAVIIGAILAVVLLILLIQRRSGRKETIIGLEDHELKSREKPQHDQEIDMSIT